MNNEELLVEDDVEYVIQYRDDGNGLTLKSVYPESSYLEESFYNGSLLYNVDLEDMGLFALTVTLSEDGIIKVVNKAKFIGWISVEI